MKIDKITSEKSWSVCNNTGEVVFGEEGLSYYLCCDYINDGHEEEGLHIEFYDKETEEWFPEK